MPIYASTSFVFEDVQTAADLFALQTYGNIYTQIGNPTTAAFEERMRLAPAVMLVVAACAGAVDQVTTTVTALEITTTTELSTTGLASSTTERPTTTNLTTSIAEAAFVYTIDPVEPALLTASWREGCPVGPEDLRLITLTHWGFDGTSRTGKLVVHRDHDQAMASAFGRLFELGFPVERIELVDVYGGDDDASMAANNTSAFNCRTVARTDVWSEHAFGRAIDINPVQNPYVSTSGQASPPAGAAYLDRSNLRPGMVTPAVVEAFAAIGWEWGGAWDGPIDYQHFSASGR